MTNPDVFTWNEIAQLTGGQWLKKPAGDGTDTFLDDSRKITAGCLFFAIAGELADGHNYICQAAQAGAGAVCVQREPGEDFLRLSCACLLVQDSLKAFQAIASAHRLRYALPVLAVTGSAGKTSTKEMCAAVLESRWPGQVVKTIGNTNNHFGVPRNLFRIHADTKAAVIETGSNHPGEIASLGRIVHPTASLICSIGAAHLEFFHDLFGVAEEKGDIFEATASGGPCVLPADATGKDILLQHAGSNHRPITFGLHENADVQAVYGGLTEEGYLLTLIRHDTGESISFTWPIGGECQASNAAAAAAAGIALGLSLPEIAKGLQACQLPGARMSQSEIHGVHWVNDAYNANPDSMRASLKWFREISVKAPSRHIVVGDMRELGEASIPSHEAILDEISRLFPCDHLVTIGQIFAPLAEARGIEHYATVEEASTLSFPEGAWVFLKASFGTGLYKLVPKES